MTLKVLVWCHLVSRGLLGISHTCTHTNVGYFLHHIYKGPSKSIKISHYIYTYHISTRKFNILHTENIWTRKFIVEDENGQILASTPVLNLGCHLEKYAYIFLQLQIFVQMSAPCFNPCSLRCIKYRPLGLKQKSACLFGESGNPSIASNIFVDTRSIKIIIAPSPPRQLRDSINLICIQSLCFVDKC